MFPMMWPGHTAIWLLSFLLTCRVALCWSFWGMYLGVGPDLVFVEIFHRGYFILVIFQKQILEGAHFTLGHGVLSESNLWKSNLAKICANNSKTVRVLWSNNLPSGILCWGKLHEFAIWISLGTLNLTYSKLGILIPTNSSCNLPHLRKRPLHSASCLGSKW